MIRIICLLLGFCVWVQSGFAPDGRDIQDPADQPAATTLEVYYYEAYPVNSRDPEDKQAIDVTIARSPEESSYTTTSRSFDEVEYVRLEMDGEGRFRSGVRNVAEPEGELKFQGRIRRVKNEAMADRMTRRGWRTRTYSIPENEPLAVHGSLLILLRDFPFDSGEEWRVFMVDFSQNSISLTVRQPGTERVTVPAGEFDCYLMELVVKVLVFQARITYWVTTEKPHFLVKHRGKIGPFSKTYVTELVRIGKEKRP